MRWFILSHLIWIYTICKGLIVIYLNSFLQTETDIFANSVALDEMAHNKPSHLDFLLDFVQTPLFLSIGMPKFKGGRVQLRKKVRDKRVNP